MEKRTLSSGGRGFNLRAAATALDSGAPGYSYLGWLGICYLVAFVGFALGQLIGKVILTVRGGENKMDTSALVAKRDALNADIGKLLVAGSVTQDQIDKVAGELDSVDTDVKSILNVPPALDFTAFDAAVAAFKADPKLTQAAIDVATGAITASTV